MERETKRYAGKVAASAGCVLLAVFTALQLVTLVFMLEMGVYARNSKDARNEMLSNILEQEAWRICDGFQVMGQEEAVNHAEDWYRDTNVNYEIIRNGKVIYSLHNWSGGVAEEFSYDFVFYQSDTVYSEDGDEITAAETQDEYTVNCQLPEDYVYEDELSASVELFEFFRSIRYGILVTLCISILAVIVLFVVAVKCTGRRQEDGSIRLRWIDRIPMDVYLAILLAVGMLASAVVVSLDYGLYGYRYLEEYLLLLLELGAWTGAVTALLLQFAGSCRVRAHHGHVWRNSLCYRILAFFGKWFRYFRGHSSLLVKGIVIFGGISFLEFFVTLCCWWGDPGGWVFLFLVEKAVLLFLLCVALVNMKKLKEAGKKIAAGDLQYQTDTRHMLWEFREFGNTLNQISGGMQCAVEEQMKSERFRTELITNVSHDIKTPLTSIINYVDLLSREEADNPNTREYLEVLNRQSARLKKLIEDLIEASKASSGTLNVQWEDCEVGVMLTQAAGEYEERLQKNQLELVMNQPEEPLMIRADGRHLWRVFDNLLNNINKYAQPGTRVYLDLERHGTELRMIFRNTSRYALHMTGEELVQRFARGDSSRNTEGSGLGLSIAQSLTELMGGGFRLTVDGDLFKVILTFSCKN